MILPRRSRDQDTVLNRQRVCGQALYVPVPDGADVHQERDNIEILSHRDFSELRTWAGTNTRAPEKKFRIRVVFVVAKQETLAGCT